MKINEVVPETTFFKGDSRGVILFHAYTGSPNDVRSLGRYLNNQGYSVLLPLFAGHGTKRPEDILESGPDFWQEDVTNSVASMQAQGCTQLAVLGLSLGGIFAMSALERYPDLVIGGGPLCSPIVPESKTNIVPSFHYFAKKLIEQSGASEELVEQRLKTIETHLTQQLLAIKELTTTVYNRLDTVRQSTLLVQAGKDQMIDPQDVYIIEKALINSKTTVKWYPESGHVITVGPAKQALQQDVLDYVDTLPWQS